MILAISSLCAGGAGWVVRGPGGLGCDHLNDMTKKGPDLTMDRLDGWAAQARQDTSGLVVYVVQFHPRGGKVPVKGFQVETGGCGDRAWVGGAQSA